MLKPLLDLVIPCHQNDRAHLSHLLESIYQQTYPKERIIIHVITKGNSEEAKAMGITSCQGDLIGMFCADNVLLDPTFLDTMASAASGPFVIGAYPRYYTYAKTDTLLSRYFALLGANDPLCWWLGKADRQSYLHMAEVNQTTIATFTDPLPSLGDNGCFFKRQALHLVVNNPQTFGSCMCACQDLCRLGYSTWAVTPNAIWHRTGEDAIGYFQRRYRYVKTLYFQKKTIRRWHMVETPRDYLLVATFILSSLVLLPHLWVSTRGYRRIRDWSWYLHAPVCLCLTLTYTWAVMTMLFQWLFQRLTVRRN